MAIYEEKEKVNGQKRYYIRTYIKDGNKKKQITKHNKRWVGRDGYWLAQQEENKLKFNIYNYDVNITLKELANNYLEYKKPMIKFSTYIKYEQNYNYYIDKYLGHIKIKQLSSTDIIKWQQQLNKRNLSMGIKKGTFITLGSILKYGVQYYGLENNPIKNVDNFKTCKGDIKKEMNYLTEDEFKSFISYESNNLYKAYFILSFYTGMRRGEILALRKSDINFKTNEISISKTYSPRYKVYGIEETTPKTSKSNRTIKMLNVIIPVLKELVENNIGERLFDNITLTTLARKCKNNLKKADISKNIRIHDFRHSFASMCINKDVPAAVLSSYLGHENITTTLNIYSHLYPDSQDKILTLLNGIL